MRGTLRGLSVKLLLCVSHFSDVALPTSAFMLAVQMQKQKKKKKKPLEVFSSPSGQFLLESPALFGLKTPIGNGNVTSSMWLKDISERCGVKHKRENFK